MGYSNSLFYQNTFNIMYRKIKIEKKRNAFGYTNLNYCADTLNQRFTFMIKFQ